MENFKFSLFPVLKIGNQRMKKLQENKLLSFTHKCASCTTTVSSAVYKEHFQNMSEKYIIQESSVKSQELLEKDGGDRTGSVIDEVPQRQGLLFH